MPVDQTRDLRLALEEARQQLLKQSEALKRFETPPFQVGVVVALGQKTALVSAGGSKIEVETAAIKVKPGDVVRLFQQMGAVAIVGKLPIEHISGSVVKVRRVLDNTSAEIESDLGEGVRIVAMGHYTEDTLKAGDRVVLDESQTVILHSYGQERLEVKTEPTGVSWNDIGGLEAAKEALIEAVELPYKHPKVFERYGKKPPKGVLLHGPPGTGKTMLGKAVATAIAQVHKKEGSAGFMYVKATEILNMYVGKSESNVRDIFDRARYHYAQHGYPAVIFVDEADAVLYKRGTAISSDIDRTIVPAFLTEMDGLDSSAAIVILATNRPDTLDPAVLRDGRIDRKIKVNRPDKRSASDIFHLNLKKVPLDNGYSHRELADFAADEMYAPERVLYTVADRKFTFANLVNGGMIASTVDQATSIALRRDLEEGNKSGGLRKSDLTEAINAVVCQNRDLDHTDDLNDFAESIWGGSLHSLHISPFKEKVTC